MKCSKKVLKRHSCHRVSLDTADRTRKLLSFSISDVIDWTTLYFRILELSTCRLIRSDVLELDTNDKLISGDNHLLLDRSDY